MIITPTEIRVIENRRLDTIATAGRARLVASASRPPRPRRFVARVRALVPDWAAGQVRRAVA